MRRNFVSTNTNAYISPYAHISKSVKLRVAGHVMKDKYWEPKLCIFSRSTCIIGNLKCQLIMKLLILEPNLNVFNVIKKCLPYQHSQDVPKHTVKMYFLVTHVQCHVNADPSKNNYSCNECGKVFSKSSNLNRPTETHDEKNNCFYSWQSFHLCRL